MFTEENLFKKTRRIRLLHAKKKKKKWYPIKFHKNKHKKKITLMFV